MEENIIKLIDRIQKLDNYYENIDHDLRDSVLDLIWISKNNINEKWYDAKNDCYETIWCDWLNAKQIYQDLTRIKRKYYS